MHVIKIFIKKALSMYLNIQESLFGIRTFTKVSGYRKAQKSLLKTKWKCLLKKKRKGVNGEVKVTKSFIYVVW